jgi:exodeoxyribonuclease X
VTDQIDMTYPARIARVLDLETTGFAEDPYAAICEVGFIDVDVAAAPYPIIDGSAWQSLINPGVPIPPLTMAVHHITDEDVVDAPKIAHAQLALAAGMNEADVYCAHNAKFEQTFYRRPAPWVCTYRCALRAWPDAPAHSNSVLRYWLGLELDRERAMPPHRALPDAYVTAHILRKLLLLRPLARLVEISKEPGFLPKFTFGKHFGKTFKEVRDVDRSYLVWIVEKSDLDEDIQFTSKHWLGLRS